MSRVITFGELMLRLAPEGYYRFVQADTLGATFGGGEANVAVSLANYGVDAAFVSKLPKHEIGQAAVNSLRKYGVDTSLITRGGDRVGIYYLEKGASQRGSVCIYDRVHSAIQEAQPSDFDWDVIFDGADWFHFTGITPALGSNLVEICKEACVAAKKHGVKISCDLNYRGKLWTREQARAAMTELCQYVDVCISNEEDAKDVFGIEAENTDIYGGKLNKEGYKSVTSSTPINATGCLSRSAISRCPHPPRPAVHSSGGAGSPAPTGTGGWPGRMPPTPPAAAPSVTSSTPQSRLMHTDHSLLPQKEKGRSEERR